jgi:ATP-dependent helicase YprA (DUF1998 family)
VANADPHRPTTGPLRTVELIRDRAVEAVLGQSGLNHAGLAAEIRRQFGATDVASGALVREPVIEGAAPFIASGRTFADCSGDPLHPAVVRAISDASAEPYRFDPLAQPYRHQLEAWQHLTAVEPRSVLVSSGTGSGKTECFLMPLLSDLATEADGAGRLSGVRAIALYPLNALIASQEERLRAWTAPFGDRLRFGLYNGLTLEKPRRTDPTTPEQVRDRATLRRDPPPILVTNVTMLEYMIVRRIDRPLIENSRGTLRWIILDEAHSYVGSAAAEIALLIRRVLLTFGVKAEDVRFVATSATIGDGKDVTDELRHFLRDLSGADETRVHVVTGERERVLLPPAAETPVLTPEQMENRDTVAASPAVQAFVRAAEKGPIRLDEARAMLASVGEPVERVIKAVAGDQDAQRGPLLPLRVHSFLRAVPGVWSCLDPDCAEAPGDWPFGRISADRIDRCPACASPVFEVKACRECGESFLECEERDGYLRAVTTPPTVDEFAATIDRDQPEEEAEEAAQDDAYEPTTLALATRSLAGRRDAFVEPATGRRPDRADDKTRLFLSHSVDLCGQCGAKSGRDAGPVLRPLRYGAPFLIGNAAPVLLEGVPRGNQPPEGAYAPPAEGRQLLSFTDSRQGTARFAAGLQTNAERGYVRGHIYHAVQGSMARSGGDSVQAENLRAEIAALEPAAGVPTIAELLTRKRAALDALSQPSTGGVPWADLRASLAAAEPVKKWMRDVWQQRDERYRADPLVFAEFLLLRELARRPRRANTIETMGLARLRFPDIDTLSHVPEPLGARGFDAAAWQNLLYTALDMVVRNNLGIRAADGDVHWITSRGFRKVLKPFGESADFASEIRWPRLDGKSGRSSNLVLILEKALGLDRTDAQERAQLNAVLESAWNALHPLFHSNIQPNLALDFTKAHLAPVVDAWRCPVTRRVLPALALGRTPYGHRDHLKTADAPPKPLVFPHLPLTFPRGSQVETIREWLDADTQVAELRVQGMWSDLHDRVALLAPYLRAAEHSAQQPPARLRRFEAEFKQGAINILNCSTTMEMGVDIGSVSAVMMTNVPPALANYRQRVGRAGRRRQGFASSLTYTRDTPLDREAFRDPQAYLARETRAPRVKLDSRRIVQRHVNALLLARWFADAGGEAMKTRVGDFFGLPAEIGLVRQEDAPVATCLAWLRAPSTQDAMRGDVAALVRGTVLAGDQTVFSTGATALERARNAVSAEWDAIQQQAAGAPKEGKDSLGFQLKRLVGDNLLRELGYRGFLPAHGFPTGVVPFVNQDKPSEDERGGDEADDTSRRRRSFPTRTLDIAIRDYAPGAEVVVDGLVYRSAGVTLNWLRPADQAEVREVQSLKTFWSCGACGAADCGHVAPPACPQCHADIGDRQRRFLEPAGFTADMAEKPHADTDQVTYVEPEIEQIVARGAAWSPMADPMQGRMRASSEGLVFYSSRGPRPKMGYHVCLDCGRAAPAAAAPGAHPLKDHAPLRFTKRNADGRCPGNDKAFAITLPIALGHETVTDVVELQPTGLESEGAAWAVLSALREALARRLGIETGELGMAVRRVATLLGQTTHSLFLYDRASGGAGFAPQAVTRYDELLQDAAKILACPAACMRGCSACVLTADLYAQAEIIDRRAAGAWTELARAALVLVAPADQAAPGAVKVRSVADGLAEAVDAGARKVTLWLSEDSDVAALSEGRIAALTRRLADRGAGVAIVVTSSWIDSLDAAQRLALRDSAVSLGLTLQRGSAPLFPNGATGVAMVEGSAWVSRDRGASRASSGWGEGQEAPIVRIVASSPRLMPTIDLAALLPVSGTRYLEIGNQLNGPMVGFGERLVALLLPAIRAAGGTGRLGHIAYNDRYLQSPLTVRLMADTLAALRNELAEAGSVIPARIATNPLKPNDRQPFAPDHDWQFQQDRDAVLLGLVEGAGLTPQLVDQGADHGRVLTLEFLGGKTVRLVFDQGFGPWRTPRYAKWDHFGADVGQQLRKIRDFNAIIEARGPSYVVVTV